jgi:hypothetical protein
MMLKTPPLTIPAPTLENDWRPVHGNVKQSYLRTQIACRDLTATMVQAKETARTAALKLKNSTLLKRCFLVKQ